MGPSKYLSHGLWVTSGTPCKPVLLRYRSSEAFILAVVSVAWYTDMFLYGIIVPVFPFALKDRLDIRDEDTQYWTSILLAVFGVSQLVCALVFGYISDRLGSRKPFMYIGLIALSLATILLCVGTSLGVLIAGRVLQGASAAMVGSVALAIVVDTVPKNQIGRAMGVISIFTGLATVLAPVLGGVVYSKSGYTGFFAMAFGFIGLDLVLRLAMIERSEASQWDAHAPQPRDTELHSRPSQDLSRNIPRGSSGVATSGSNTESPTETSWVSSFKSFPMFQLLKSPVFLAALWGITVLAALMTAFDSTIPLYTKNVFGFNSLGGGAIMFALLGPSLASPIAGDVSDKYGRRWLATAGFVLTVPFLILLRLVDHHTTEQIVLLCALLVLVGLAITLSMAPIMSEIAHCGITQDIADQSGKSNAFAQAFGVASCAFAAGTVLGPVWGGLILTHAGWATMTWTISLLSVSAALSSSIFISNTIDQEE